MITLACLDLAGTTVSDDGIVTTAVTDALATQGIVAGTDAHAGAMARVHDARGRSKLEIFRSVFASDDQARAAHLAFERSYDTAIDRVGLHPLPGAEEALDEITEAGIKICLMTGFSRTTLGRVIDTLGWWKRADLLLCPEDAGGRGRPYPDMILHALLRLHIDDVHSTAVCGDTTADIQAGTRAGATIVAGVLTGAHDQTRLTTAGATHILPTIADLPTLLTR